MKLRKIFALAGACVCSAALAGCSFVDTFAPGFGYLVSPPEIEVADDTVSDAPSFTYTAPTPPPIETAEFPHWSLDRTGQLDDLRFSTDRHWQESAKGTLASKGLIYTFDVADREVRLDISSTDLRDFTSEGAEITPEFVYEAAQLNALGAGIDSLAPAENTDMPMAWTGTLQSSDEFRTVLVLSDGTYLYMMVLGGPAEKSADLTSLWISVMNVLRVGDTPVFAALSLPDLSGTSQEGVQ